MFGLGGLPLTNAVTQYYLRSYAVLFIFGIVGATPLLKNTANRLLSSRRTEKWAAILEPAVLIGLLLICTAYLVDGSFNPFLYFRF